MRTRRPVAERTVPPVEFGQPVEQPNPSAPTVTESFNQDAWLNQLEVATFPAGIEVGDPVTTPSTPSGVTAAGGLRSVLVEWTAVGGLQSAEAAGAYEVTLDTSSAFNVSPRTQRTSGTSVTWADLTSNTTYYARVRAVQGTDNVSAWSATVTATTSFVKSIDLPPDSAFVLKVATLPALPNASYPPGQVVFCQADGKLYRNVADVWTAEVPTTDLTGQVTTTQITDGAVTTDKVAANAITAGKIAANTITAGEIAAGAVTADELAANAVTAAKLAAVQLEVGKYIRSTTYTPGVAGWGIEADGSAEFNNVTVRGVVDIIDSTDGSSVVIGQAGDAKILLGSGSPDEVNPGGIYGEYSDGFTYKDRVQLRLEAPQSDATITTRPLIRIGQHPANPAGRQATVSTYGELLSHATDALEVQPMAGGANFFSTTATATTIGSTALDVNASGAVTIDGATIALNGDDVMGAWTSYTMGWLATTTNPAIGNGSLSSHYKKIGKTLHIVMRWYPGSTTTFGTGTYVFYLPGGISAASSGEQRISGTLWRGGVGLMPCSFIIAASGTGGNLYVGTGAMSAMTNTNPYTWANGDNFIVQGTIEVA